MGPHRTGEAGSMKQILIAIGQLANTVIGGWADETLSSRAWREERRVLIAVLFGRLRTLGDLVGWLVSSGKWFTPASA